MSEPESASASRALAGEWLAKAQQDLEVAELILGSHAARWAACFHTQQAAEKAIPRPCWWIEASTSRALTA